MRLLRLVALCCLAVGAALVAPSCSSPTGLPAAADTNTVDTVSLFALSGTPVTQPSAYVLDTRQRVRTDQSTVLDFAFDIDSTHRAELLPTDALHLGVASALRRAGAPFDSVKIAPGTGWVFDSAVVVGPDSVVLVSSRLQTCITGIVVPLYAKLRVLAVDTTARRIDFEILVDQNCGYRGLEPGLPQQ